MTEENKAIMEFIVVTWFMALGIIMFILIKKFKKWSFGKRKEKSN
jgi:hypothetical protein